MVVVTGANRGIGSAVASELARRGRRVVAVCRRAEDAQAVAGQLGGGALAVAGDLSSGADARQVAEAIAALPAPITAFVHNAGVWPSRRMLTADGVEQSFAVNHLAPFLLNALLHERFCIDRTRVVQVTAGLYGIGRVDLERTPTGLGFSRLRTYADTKRCNLLLTRRWAVRAAGHYTVNAVHPGVVRTDLGAGAGLFDWMVKQVKRSWATPEQGARGPVMLVCAPELEGVTGRLYLEETPVEFGPAACDEALTDALWAQAERLCGVAG